MIIFLNFQFHFRMTDTPPSSLPSGVNRPLEGALPAPQPIDPFYNHFLPDNGQMLQSCTR